MRQRFMHFLAVLSVLLALPGIASAQAGRATAIVCEVDQLTLGFARDDGQERSYGGAVGITVITAKDYDGKEYRLVASPRVIRRGEIIHVSYTPRTSVSVADVFAGIRNLNRSQSIDGVSGLVGGLATMDKAKNPGFRCDAPERTASKSRTFEKP